MSKKQPVDFSPKAFLKTRRPEIFSDTVVETIATVDRSLLEYHLASVTSRSQEVEFARFAHKLCEKEICPNLLPQTGPTGGGDSKVDAETYPVADSLALSWYEGIGRAASEERWAFAFSAKEKWIPKFRSDIAKLVATKRGYLKAFFVTNQAIADKKRATEEDALRKKYGIDVRILDRTWILNRMFAGRHEQLAVEELKVTAFSRRNDVKGPLDMKRERDLEQVEARLQQALSESRSDIALVDVALEAAILARGLERSQVEIIGRFNRAKTLAEQFGTHRQKVEIAYQIASTSYWWFEDVSAFADHYIHVEALAHDSENPYDLERLMTLWCLLHSAVKSRNLTTKDEALPVHTKTLLTALKRLRDEKDNRPSAALQAETLLCQVGLIRHLNLREQVDGYLRSLKNIIERSKALVGFPLEPLIKFVEEMGYPLGDSTEYASLFEATVAIASENESEIRAAKLFLSRGESQIIKGHPVDAIVSLGRALLKLLKHESRHDLVRALYLCGCAYNELGLPWAARGTLLNAASVAIEDFFRYGNVTPFQAACFRRLKRIELELGRIPCALAWHEVDLWVRTHLVGRGYSSEQLFEGDVPFQIMLGKLLLKAEFSDLKSLGALPDVLDALALPISADALLFMLGHDERIRDQAQLLKLDSVEDFMNKWWNMQSDWRLAERADFCDATTMTMASQVLGCRVTIECEAESPCIEVSESLLAALESLLATSAIKQAIAYEPKLNLCVRLSELTSFPLKFQIEERKGRPCIDICCQRFEPHSLSATQQVEVRDIIFKIVITALAHTVKFKNQEGDLLALLHDERAADRSDFSASLMTLTKVLGKKPKTSMSMWIAGEPDNHPLLRKISWQPAVGPDPVQAQYQEESVVNDVSTSSMTWDLNRLSHTNITTKSVIRIPLWEKARWAGTAFLSVTPPYVEPPILGLLFQNPSMGIEIFKNWQQEIDLKDKHQQIRIAIIRGIDKVHPHAYKMIIGSELREPDKNHIYNMVSRIQRMDAVTSVNLERFLAARDSAGEFYLAPAHAHMEADDTFGPPKFELDFHIKLRDIYVRYAWEIGPNDEDRVAIAEDDDPIIPDTVKDAPIEGILRARNIH